MNSPTKLQLLSWESLFVFASLSLSSVVYKNSTKSWLGPQNWKGEIVHGENMQRNWAEVREKRRLAYHKMLRTAQRQCACKPIIAVGMDMRNSRRDNCRFRGAREIADFLYLNACVCVCGVAAIVNWLGLGGAFASMFYCRKLLEETQLAEMDHCRRFYVQLFEAILPFASTSPRRISTKLPATQLKHDKAHNGQRRGRIWNKRNASGTIRSSSSLPDTWSSGFLQDGLYPLVKSDLSSSPSPAFSGCFVMRSAAAAAILMGCLGERDPSSSLSARRQIQFPLPFSLQAIFPNKIHLTSFSARFHFPVF